MAAGILLEGVGVGHWTDSDAMTGCTVVVLPTGTVASGEIRGGAPATREFGLLHPGCTVTSLDAVVLSGGSAFGLAAGHGVAAELEAQGRGYETKAGPIPIVVGLSLFDLTLGRADVRPNAENGATALEDAQTRIGQPMRSGRLGAGVGATVGTWRGVEHRRRAGLGIAEVAHGDVRVIAIVVVNAVGDIDDGTGAQRLVEDPSVLDQPVAPLQNTTIGCVLTTAALDKNECHQLAQGAHDGLARAVYPTHTPADGDAFVAVTCGDVEAPLMETKALTVAAVERAIRSTASIS